MEFRILGPLEARVGGQPLVVGRGRQRALLALLLLQRNAPISSDRLIDALWGAHPPPTVATVLQGYVSKLRKALGHDAIATVPAGYVLTLAPGSLDAEVFDRLAEEGREALAAGQPRRAGEVLRRALALWRGPPLAEFALDPFAQLDIARLEELRLAALETRIEADLALGRHLELVPELELLVAQHPLRERLRAQLMLALYRSARQAEALALYRQTREVLVDELGIEPTPALQELERAILRQDAALEARPEPPSTEPRREAALPAPATSFVGRERELAELQALLGHQTARLVTLTGPGGAGKTRLAVEAARASGCPASFVDLSAIRDAARVPGAIADALGLREVPRHDALAILVTHLRGSPLLLVLDNLEQVPAAAPAVDELLDRAREVRILATSRSPLRLSAEAVMPVPPLALETEAVELFLQRAQAVRPELVLTEENAADVGELCRLLGGLPLALELAAARVTLLSPRAIVARLGRWLDLLRSSAPDVPERQRSLRATIEWSYDLLPPGEQALFAGLATFVGGFAVDAAEAVAGDLGLEVVDGVESLLAANLLRPAGSAGDEPRFGMLETVRVYALERLAARDDAADLRRRHAAFYGSLAAEGEAALRDRRQAAFLQRLDADDGNLRAAVDWAVGDGDVEVGLRLAASLWRYWQIRGGVDDGRDALERLLACRGGTRLGRAAAQLSAARSAFFQSDFEAMDRYLARCEPVHRQAGDLYSACFAQIIRGLAASGRHDPEQGLRFFDEALALARRSGDRWLQSFVLANSSIVQAAAGNLTAARRALEEGLRGLREAGDARSVGWVLMQLGRVNLEHGDLEAARSRLAQALDAQRALGDRWGVVYSLNGLASVALLQARNAAAEGFLRESLDVAAETLERGGLAEGLELLGRLAVSTDRPLRAARLYACASVVREVATVHPYQIDHSGHDDELAVARGRLGDDVFAEAWAEGRAMTLADALAYARQEQDQPEREGVDV